MLFPFIFGAIRYLMSDNTSSTAMLRTSLKLPVLQFFNMFEKSEEKEKSYVRIQKSLVYVNVCVDVCMYNKHPALLVILSISGRGTIREKPSTSPSCLVRTPNVLNIPSVRPCVA